MLTALIPEQVNVLSSGKYVVIHCRGSIIRNKIYLMTTEITPNSFESQIILKEVIKIKQQIYTNIRIDYGV